MAEVWLRPNRRALLLGMIVPASLAITGLCLIREVLPIHTPWASIVGGSLLALGAISLVALAWQLTLPRVAYQQGHVLFYLKSGAPIRVPLEVIECFFIGQGPALLPGSDPERTQTANVVVRLAEKAQSWSRLQVKPSLGKWCEGYITIRGTWCEPLDSEVVLQLNRQLTAAKRAWKAIS